MLGTKFLQHGRQQIHQRGERSADLHAADPAIAETAHRRLDRVRLVRNAARVVDHLAAGRGRVGLLAEALDQPQAATLLELADLHTHRRLRQVQQARRPGEAGELHDGFERPQLVEIQAAH